MRGHGRGAGVGRDLGVGATLGVVAGVAVGVAVAVAAAVAVGVGEGVGVGVGPDTGAQYLPPLLKMLPRPLVPPQTIISLSVQTAGADRAEGALVVLVAVQLSVLGSLICAGKLAEFSIASCGSA
jgi:hypothetical protein